MVAGKFQFARREIGPGFPYYLASESISLPTCLTLVEAALWSPLSAATRGPSRGDRSR